MTAIDLPRGFGLDARARRVLAAQIAFRLSPAAWAADCYASSAALHAPAGREPRRPDVIVASGEVPADGIVRAAPLLVVDLGDGSDPAGWLDRGAGTVWVIGPEVGIVLTAAGHRRVTAGGSLQVEGTGLALTVPWRPGCGEAATSPVAQAVG